MSNETLEAAQGLALRQAVVAELRARGYLPRTRTLSAASAKALRELRAARARERRGARKYLHANVVLPVGTPAPETMREAKKVPVGNPALWEEHAPASGCREMRSISGVYALKQERDAYGKTLVYAAPCGSRWSGAEYYRLVHSDLPAD